MYCTKAISTFNPDRLSFSFRVIVGLLERGQGVLAGRLARKVFPQAEALLNIDGPPFIWNILDIIYGIGIYGQTQLLHMLLQYLIGVARSNYPPTHPILHILRSLKSLVHSWEDNAEPFQVATLEQGWALNANLLFGRFNSKFILLYYRLEWDSALFKLPQAWVKEADWWFSALESEITPDNPIPEEMMETDLDRSHPFDAEFRTELPGNYERLKSDVIATIEERSSMDFDDPRVRVRVLSGRLKSLTLQDDDAGRSKSQFIGAAQKKTRTLRLHARILAFLIKIVIESDADLGVSDELAVEKTRNIIALQKFGQGPIDPQVVYELWQLERLLLQRGDSEQAAATREETYKLLEHYLVDVPVDMDYIPART
jgi:hypothetical protein